MPSLLARVASFKTRLSDILDDFRHLTHELHPRHLDTVSLAYSMRTYIKEFIEYSNVPVEFNERNVPAHLPMPITVCLYRLLQESLGNIRKHANAKHVTVELSAELSAGKTDIVLSVSDDGTGFELSDQTKGLGLTSMQERIRPLRGQVSINSKPGTGTCVSIRIPVPSEG
jgi:signal transduction histidine kinase